MTSRGISSFASFALLLVALVAVNVLAGFLPLRLDITEESIYTLSEGTARILAKIEEPVTVKYFFTESERELPVTIKTYATKVRELLRQYASRSGGNLTLEVIDPRPDTDEEEWATRYGLNGAQLPNGGRLFHGMVVLSGGLEAILPFFDVRREKFLEYDISETISRVGSENKDKLGLITFLPMQGQPNPRSGRLEGEWAVLGELRKMFEIEDLLAKEDMVEVPDDIRMVMLIHPKALTKQMAYALDQFLLRGGRLMVFTDPFSRYDTSNPNLMDSNFSSTLGALFKAWKVKFDHTMVVADLAQATRVNTPTHGVVEYPVWITVRGDHFNRESVVTSQLEQIVLPDAGAFEEEEGSDYVFTPLLTSSKSSGLVDRITIRMSKPLDVGKSFEPDGKSRVLAALVSGKFESAFPEGPPPPPPPPEGGKEQAAENKIERKLPHLAKAEKESTVLLMGDADFMGDRFSVRAANFFGQTVYTPLNDNLNFVLNAVEFMSGNQDLIHIRSRGKISRPFTRVSELQTSAQQQYREEEKILSESLAKVRERLREVENKKPKGKNVILNTEQIQEIRKFRLEEAQTQRALREVRKVLRQDIESLGNKLLAINVLAVPLLVALLGFVAIIRRTRRSGGGAA